MYYHFKIHKDKNGYWAECIELQGCNTQADTKKELYENMKEALNLFLDEPAESNVLFPLPKKRLKAYNIMKVPVNTRIAFSFLLRRERLLHKMTQKEVAKKIGVKNIYNYQRLEYSKTANPALSTLVKIKEVFPDLNIDDVII